MFYVSCIPDTYKMYEHGTFVVWSTTKVTAERPHGPCWVCWYVFFTSV